MTGSQRPEFIASVRKRPGMYVGDTETYGLHHLVYFLLDAVFSDARRGECGDVVLESGGDGSVTLFSTCRIVPPSELVRVLTEHHFALEPEGYSAGWCGYAPVSLALSSRYQVDLWEHGRQWRLLGAQGRPSGEVTEVTPAEPVPAGGSRGMRLRFVPEADIFGGRPFDEERLSSRCRELAVLAPGLRVRFTSARTGQSVLLHYPGGIAQWAAELTSARVRLHPEPLVFDLQWEGLRVRCALQWCEGEGTLLSFANTVRTTRHGAHVDGVMMALFAALVRLTGERPAAFCWEGLTRGLTAIIAVDGPDERMAFAGPTKQLLAIKGLKWAVRLRLRPRLMEALREHPLTPGLVQRARVSRGRRR